MIDSSQNKRIEYSPVFIKLIANAPTAIKVAFRDALDLFAENPNHPALRNHPLTGKYAGFHSIDVTEDWRALYREEKERIMFADLGTHEQLYG
jgi:addiction module RelE/StbE family toxin